MTYTNICTYCGSTNNVEKVRILTGRRGRPREVLMCSDCYWRHFQ
jgi:hypothetical protein